MHRRDFLRRGAIAGSAAVATTNWNIPFVQQVFELEESTIADLQRGMHEGRWTARMITQAYLARIEELDQQGPALHSILETNPDALAIADELDRERRAKGPTSALSTARADGALAGGSVAIRMYWIATHAAPAPGPGRRPRRISELFP